MRNILLILFTIISFGLFGQDIKPIDPINFKLLQSPSFSRYLKPDAKDNEIWLYGSGLWNELATSNYVDTTVQRISTGCVTEPIITDNGDGTATISSVKVNIYPTSDFSGNMISASVATATFTFTDKVEEYISVRYNNGTPIYYKETIGTIMNHSDILPVAVVWRLGTVCHSLNFDSLGSGLANKAQSAMYHVNPYQISSDGGLVITEVTTPNPRTVNVTGGLVYTGAVHQDVSNFNSSTDQMTECINTSSGWTYSDKLVYNNTQVNNGTTLSNIGNSKFAVRWWYRSIGDSKQLFYVLGTVGTYNSESAAALEKPRTDLPPILKHHCMLVGRSIIGYNATSGITESLVQPTFSFSGIINHDDTGNKSLAGLGVTWGHIDNQAQTIYGIKDFNSIPTSTGTPTIGAQLTNKNYVDTKDPSINNEIQSPILSGNTLGLTQTTTTVNLTGNNISNTPFGTLTNTTVQNVINELEIKKVPFTVLDDSKDPTGFLNGSGITITYNWTTRTTTLTGDLTYYWRGQKKSLTSPWTSPAHAATLGKWFLSSTDGTNFTWSQSMWSFYDIQVMTVFYKATDAASIGIRETHGLMPWQSHEEDHQQIGTYLTSGGQATAGTYILNTATDAATTPGFDAFVLKDEDNSSSELAWIEGTYTTMYIGASNTSVFNIASSFPFLSSGSYIQWNNATTGVLNTGSNNSFYNVYTILMPVSASVSSQKYRVIMLQPQVEYTSLVTAQAESVSSLNLGEIASFSPEFKIYARLTYGTNTGDGNTGKCRLQGITYILGSNGSVTNVPLTSNNHAALSNLTWANSGHLGTNNTLAAFDASGVTTNLTKGNLTAGSNKITIGGIGTNALIGTGASVDINESNLTLSNIGGSVTDAQVPNTITLDNITQITNRSHTSLSDIGTNTHPQIDAFIASKGNSNGLATLDAGGKVPFSQLPASLMIYKGTWSALTNSPTLTDGVGTAGWVYKNNLAGTVNFGSGNISFYAGDWVIYNGTTWERSVGTDNVLSVNNLQGIVTLNLGSSASGSTRTITITGGSSTSFSVDDHTNRTALNNVSGINTGDQSLSFNSGTGSLTISSGNMVNLDGRYLQSNQPITFTASGDISGTATGTTSLLPTLTLSTITQGSGSNFVKLSIDTKGRVVGNTAISSSDIIGVLGYTPVTNARTLTINGIAQDLSANRTWNVGTVTSVTATTPLSSSGGTSPNITIQQASTSQSGYLSSTDWNTFNNKQGTLALTTTGNSGVATLIGTTLNVPNYSLSGLGGTPTSRVLTINNTSQDLSIDRTWNVGTITSVVSGNGMNFNTITGSGSIALGVPSTITSSSTNTVTATSHNHAITPSLGLIGNGTAQYQVPLTGANPFTPVWSTLSTSNVNEGTNLYYTDSRARQSISLTTTGSSGSSTYSNSTGVFNIPTYTLAGLGGQPLNSILTSISGLVTNQTGLIKLTNGTASLDQNTYLTGNQTITLSGAVSGSGTTAITTSLVTPASITGSSTNTGGTGAHTHAVSGLTNANLSGSAGITNANLANSSITINGVATALGGTGTITANTPNSEIIKFDTGSTEGTDLYTFNGSISKTIDIRAGSNVTLTKSAGGVVIHSSNPGGTVTSVSGTGSVSGISLTGTVTNTGSLTLGGTITGLTTTNLSTTAGITNGQLANSTISGISLGSNLNSVTFNNSGSGDVSGSTYNGSTAKTVSYNTVGAAPVSGSGNYIQNGTATQTANYNITGNGTIGGMLNIGLSSIQQQSVAGQNGNLLLSSGGSNAVVNIQPLTTNASRFYITPKGTPTGTTGKFDLFNTDYIADGANYNGTTWFANNTTSVVNFGNNRLGTAPRLKLIIGADYVGSSLSATSSRIDFNTDETVNVNQAGGGITLGIGTPDPFGFSIANQYTFKNPITNQATRVNIVGNGTASGVLAYGTGLIRNAHSSIVGGTSDYVIALNRTNSGTTITDSFRLFGSSGNLVLQDGGSFIDNGYKLQVTGNIYASGLLRSIGNVVSDAMVQASTAKFTTGAAANSIFVSDASGLGSWKTLNIVLSPNISGTSGYISKFTGTNSIGNSIMYDDGTNVNIGTGSSTPYSGAGYTFFNLRGTNGAAITFSTPTTKIGQFGAGSLYAYNGRFISFHTGADDSSTEKARITNDGIMLIATTTTYTATDKLQVNGNAYFNGSIRATTAKFTTGATAEYFWKCTNIDGSGGWYPIAASQVYKGTWDASTNTPTLTNGTGTAGWYYRCTTAGTVNFGAGNITFAVGDDVSYNGTIWQRIPGQGYTLQPATASVLGGVKIGSGVTVQTDGTISVNTAYRPDSYVPSWSEITSKPTTISGFGITDAMTTSHPANAIVSQDITNWNSAYSNRITSLTTNNNSGSATLLNNVLNIPNYTLEGLNGQPLNSNLTSISALNTNSTGLVKLTNGVASFDSNNYLTGNQNITFIASGDVTGSTTGTTSLSPALTLATVTQSIGSNFIKINLDTKGRVVGNSPVVSTDIVNSLGYTPYNATNPNNYTTNTGTVTSVGLTPPTGLTVSNSPITTSGNILLSLTSGYLIPTTVSATSWDNKQTAYTNLTSIGSLANTSGWLKNNGSGVFSYSTPTKSDVGLGSVENITLSTWSGSSNLTTLGTITTGTWLANTISTSKGGTGLTSIGTPSQLLRVNSVGTGLEYWTPNYLTSYTEIDPIFSSHTVKNIINGNGLLTNNGFGNWSYQTNNATNWDNAYNSKINSISFSGTAIKSLTLHTQNGNIITDFFNDLNSTNLSSSVTSQTITINSDTGNGVTLNSATQANSGLLSATDKIKLDGIAIDVYNEIPNELPNNSRTQFTLDFTPITGTVRIYLNGLRQAPTIQYTVSGNTITFVNIPVTNDIILVDYKK